MYHDYYDINAAILNRYNKLHKIYDPILKAIENCYSIRSDNITLSLNNYNTIINKLNNNILTALASAKEKIIELENEINNATPKTEDA